MKETRLIASKALKRDIQMNRYLEQWYELEPIFRSAVQREQNGDLRPNIDWNALKQVTLGAALAAGCALLESSSKKWSNEHVDILFEIRNAFVHNQCDISKNNNKNALLFAQSYLEKEEYKKLLQPPELGPFFTLDKNKVVFQSEIFLAIRMCLL
jgi:hypothetical protein